MHINKEEYRAFEEYLQNDETIIKLLEENIKYFSTFKNCENQNKKVRKRDT
jgi:hypothetical protein